MTQGTIVGAGLSAFVLLCYVTVSTQLQPIVEALAETADTGAAAVRAGAEVVPGASRGRDGADVAREPSLAMSAAVGAAAGSGRNGRGEATQSELDRILAERGLEWDDAANRPSPAGARTLDRLVSLLVVEPDARIKVVGYADARDSDVSAAQQRAESVRRYFVESGIAADRVRAEVGDVADAARGPGADGRKGWSIEVRLEEGK